jgi:hypothetical protein
MDPAACDLFAKMVSANSGSRPTINDIRAHPWMQQPTASPEELMEFHKKCKAQQITAA